MTLPIPFGKPIDYDVLDPATKRFLALPARGFPTLLDLASVIYCSLASPKEEVRTAAQVRLVLHDVPVFSATPERLRSMGACIRAYLDGEPGRAPADVAARFSGLHDQIRAADEVRRAAEVSVAARLSGLLPEGLALDPHQITMVSEIERSDYRFLVGDDQGVGKCAEALGAVLLHDDPLPLLIVCPSSVMHTWGRECRLWLPRRTTNIEIIGNAPHDPQPDSVHITSYGALTRRQQVLAGKYRGIIYDESQYLTSPTSSRSRAALAVRRGAKLRLLLSGGPSPNGRTIEYYVQFKILDEHVFSALGGNELRQFGELYCGPTFSHVRGRPKKNMKPGERPKARSIRVYMGRSREVEFAERYMRRTLRRLKTEVFPDLPNKTRYSLLVPIGSADRMALAAARERVKASIESRCAALRLELEAEKRSLQFIEASIEASMGSLAAQLSTELRICAGEIKARWMPELLDDLVGERGKRPIVFLMHERVMDAFEQSVAKKGYKVRFGRSNLNVEKRDKLCTSFCAGDGDVLVLSSAYAEGITLLSRSHPIDTMICGERLWVPGKEMQQEDRIYRRGQILNVACWYPHIPGSSDDIVGEVCTWKETSQQVMRGSIGTRVLQWLDAASGA